MGRHTTEALPQRDFLLLLRAAIDTAIKHPTQSNIDKARQMAYAQPRAMRSAHVSRNLGATRWDWLTDHQVTIIGEEVEVAGTPARKMTITPEVKK